MNLLVLRSYGDYIILLNSISKSDLTNPITITVSSHLKPLHDSLHLKLPANFTFTFVDFKIKNGLLSVFTNKYALSINTFIELNILRKYLKNKSHEELYLEHDKRISLIRCIISKNFKYIYKNSSVYECFDYFFKSKIDHHVNTNQNKQISNVIIFPDSRKKEKEINQFALSKLKKMLNESKIDFKIASFGSNKNSTILKADEVSYSNFTELITLLKSADFIISSDSLPAHIAELYHIPHWILYNNSINYDWLTRSSKEMNYFSTVDEIQLLNKIFDRAC